MLKMLLVETGSRVPIVTVDQRRETVVVQSVQGDVDADTAGSAVNHEWFHGVTCDHLYDDCTALQTIRNHGRYLFLIGRRGRGTIDPEGTDVCGLCHIRWLQKTHDA